MFKFRKLSGAVSRTVVYGWLQILVAALLAASEFAKTGDFSPAAILVFAAGLITLYLRSQTNERLA